MVKEPPKALVKTWFDMMMQRESKEISAAGRRNLLSAFGDNESVMQALVNYQIIKSE